MTQIIANKFIDKARQSQNQFSSPDDFQKISIYNYNTFTTTMSFTRIYLFNETKPNDFNSGYSFKIDNP